MRSLLILSFLSLALVQCISEDPAFELLSESGCSTPATVRDLRGLDGCGYVFELGDGTQLEPALLFWCGTPPLSEEQLSDPLHNFEWVDGKKVLINYEILDNMGSVCMVGPIAKITCLSEVDSTAEEDESI